MMTRRNVWLKYDEWESICQELSHVKYHPFELSKMQLKEWKDRMKKYPESFDSYCFERVSIYSVVEELKSAKLQNVLYKEYYRSQDVMDVMSFNDTFAGFILNHVKNVNENTTVEEWELNRIKLNKCMNDSEKKRWFCDDIVKLYEDQCATCQTVH